MFKHDAKQRSKWGNKHTTHAQSLARIQRMEMKWQAGGTAEAAAANKQKQKKIERKIERDEMKRNKEIVCCGVCRWQLETRNKKSFCHRFAIGKGASNHFHFRFKRKETKGKKRTHNNNQNGEKANK